MVRVMLLRILMVWVMLLVLIVRFMVMLLRILMVRVMVTVRLLRILMVRIMVMLLRILMVRVMLLRRTALSLNRYVGQIHLFCYTSPLS